MANFIKESCDKSPVFKQVFYAMLRDELSYCGKTGKIDYICKVREAEDATHIDIKKAIY